MIEYIEILIGGTVIGLVAAIPVGPVGLICIQRTLANNKISGLISGLGAAVADTLLASVSAFSMTIIFSFISHHQSFLRVLSASLLIFLGIMSLRAKPDIKKSKSENAVGYAEEFLSALVITITNPLSAFLFFMAFAQIGHEVSDAVSSAILFIIGIFLGSCLWWITLTYITDRIAHKITPKLVLSINHWFSRIIIIFGILLFISVLFKGG